MLLCEHDPVLTLGRRAGPAEVLVPESVLQRHGVELVRTSRGGQVTYHGPGQLVVYPIVRLRRGVLRHVLDLAEAVIEVAASFGVSAAFDREQVGVWVGSRKLAAVGIHVQRGVAVHGLALNVTREATAPFRAGWFVPCGQAGGRVTSLCEESPRADAQAAAGALVPEAAAAVSQALLSRYGAPQIPMITASNEALLSRLQSVE